MNETLFGVGETGEVIVPTAIEQEELYRLVQVIEEHRNVEEDYWRVGCALRDIQERGLYRGYGSFDRFTKYWLKLDKASAVRFLQAYEVYQDLSLTSSVLPESERLCRELTLLASREARQRVWGEVLAFVGEELVSLPVVKSLVRQHLTLCRPRPVPAPALPVGGKYGVILADPPWRYEANTTTRNREVEAHYETMTLERIQAMAVAGLAAKDAVLFLWTTAPKDGEAHAVLRAWGFNYRTHIIWHKSGIGLGHYVRTDHEILMIAIRGNPGTPASQDMPRSVIFHQKLGHSQKPALFYDIMERMYPAARRIELFARQRREGWDAWGNEVERQQDSH